MMILRHKCRGQICELHHTGMSVGGSLRLMLQLEAAAELLGVGLGLLPYVYVGFKEAAQHTTLA